MGLGLSLIFGTTGVMNFAQGNSGMLGVFFAWSVLAWTKALPSPSVAGIAALGSPPRSGHRPHPHEKKVKGLTHEGMHSSATLGLLMAYRPRPHHLGHQAPIFPDLVTLPPLI